MAVIKALLPRLTVELTNCESVKITSLLTTYVSLLTNSKSAAHLAWVQQPKLNLEPFLEQQNIPLGALKSKFGAGCGTTKI